MPLDRRRSGSSGAGDDFGAGWGAAGCGAFFGAGGAAGAAGRDDDEPPPDLDGWLAIWFPAGETANQAAAERRQALAIRIARLRVLDEAVERVTVVGDLLACRSERMVVPTSEAFAPPLTVGLPLARSGGQAMAHAPEHALFIPESFVNRYIVRPRESTSAFPRRVLATRTVGACGAADLVRLGRRRCGRLGRRGRAAAATTGGHGQRCQRHQRRTGEEGDRSTATHVFAPLRGGDLARPAPRSGGSSRSGFERWRRGPQLSSACGRLFALPRPRYRATRRCTGRRIRPGQRECARAPATRWTVLPSGSRSRCPAASLAPICGSSAASVGMPIT